MIKRSNFKGSKVLQNWSGDRNWHFSGDRKFCKTDQKSYLTDQINNVVELVRRVLLHSQVPEVNVNHGSLAHDVGSEVFQLALVQLHLKICFSLTNLLLTFLFCHISVFSYLQKHLMLPATLIATTKLFKDLYFLIYFVFKLVFH